MPPAQDAITPPDVLSWTQETRRVGVEIEFAAVSARDGAALVVELFGGAIVEEDPHRYRIEGSEFGEFVCELDSQYAHRPKNADSSAIDDSALYSQFQAELRRLYGDISAAVLPCEIVCPPMNYSDLPRLDGLVHALRDAGAAGTRSNPLYAFGAQLNPEIASTEPRSLVSVFKAYLLASPWLREVMKIDVTRRLMAFTDPFPPAYVRKVLQEDYWPDQAQFMVDYMQANPTRNRELDLLPLFAWLDEGLVRRHVDDPRIKARPTFHYRLPDANLDDPDWSVTLEWRRWLVVERVAADPELLTRVNRAYLARGSAWSAPKWAIAFSEQLVLA